MSTPLLRPPFAEELPDELLSDQLDRWSRLSSWREASSFAQALADRDAHDVQRLRQAAATARLAGDHPTSVARFQALSALGPLGVDDWTGWVTALLGMSAHTQAAHVLTVSGLVDTGQWRAVDFAALAWWELRLRTVASEADPAESETYRDRAWAAQLTLAAMAHDGRSARKVLERMRAWWTVDRVPAGSPTAEAFVAATQRLAEAVPESRGLAALLLADELPGWALQVKPFPVPDLELSQARFLAHWYRQEYPLAMEDGHQLAALTGRSMGEQPLEGFLRYQWVRTLTEVGRLQEARDACEEALTRLSTLDDLLRRRLAPHQGGTNHNGAARGDATAEPPPSPAELQELRERWSMVRALSCYYAVDCGRIAYLQGRFGDAWREFAAAAKLDHEGLEPSTRIGLAHVAIITAPDARTAARQLLKLEQLTAEQPSAVLVGQLDTTLIEASLWVSSRWEAADGSWDDPSVTGLPRREATALRQARSRGLVRARELLAAFGDQVGVAQQMRVALLAGDELQAETLARRLPTDVAGRWDGRVLRAVLELQAGRDANALRLLRSVMTERRFDTDLRVLYAHAALLAGETEEAAQESLEIVEMAPEHTMARVVRAECAFELALRTDGASRSRSEDRSAEAVAMENVQELILAVADYHQATRLDFRTKEFLRTGPAYDGAPIGSEVLTPRQVVQVCRRGLHAAVIAQEGLDRLGLRRDRELESQAGDLVRYMRAHRPRRPCGPCGRPDPGRAADRLHRARHLGNRDEAGRLAHLMTGYRWAGRLRLAQVALLVALGVVLAGAVLFDVAQVNERVDGLGVTSVRVAVLAAGLVLIVLPFVRSVKVGVLEVQRPDRAPPISGRSKALRASTVLQRNALLAATSSLVPSVSAQLEQPVGPSRPFHVDEVVEAPASQEAEGAVTLEKQHRAGAAPNPPAGGGA